MRVPFVGADAVTAGELTPFELRRRYRPIYRGVHVPLEHQVSFRDRLAGLMLAAPGAVVAGVAASALHGADWVGPDVPIEAVTGGRRQAGLIVRNESLHPDEIATVAGIRVTTVARTAFDLARHLPREQAVARLDALRRVRRFSADEVLLLAERHRGARGLRRARIALPLVDGGAESPRETWLRLLFIDAGLPAPTTQFVVYDEDGHYVRRIDMCWEKYKVGVEYDGQQHLTSRSAYVNDVRVARVMHRLQWHVVHVIKEDRPADVLAETCSALISHGWQQ